MRLAHRNLARLVLSHTQTQPPRSAIKRNQLAFSEWCVLFHPYKRYVLADSGVNLPQVLPNIEELQSSSSQRKDFTLNEQISSNNATQRVTRSKSLGSLF